MLEYITRMGYHLGRKSAENERNIGEILPKIAVLSCRVDVFVGKHDEMVRSCSFSLKVLFL